MTKSQKKRLRKLINNYAEAYKEDSWKGGTNPDYHEGIEAKLKETKSVLYKFISEIDEELTWNNCFS